MPEIIKLEKLKEMTRESVETIHDGVKRGLSVALMFSNEFSNGYISPIVYLS